MDAVTYPDTNVAEYLEKNFITVKIDITKEDPKTQDAVHRYCQVWTPTLITLDFDGREARRQVGYVPPQEMVPDMKVALGHCYLLRKEFSNALKCFKDVVENHPNCPCAPEALYYSGVAAYKDSHAVEDLLGPWKELKAKYPHSTWWTRASFIDNKK